MNSTSMTHRNDSSRESSSRPSSGMKSSMGTRPVSPDNVVHDHNTSALTQGTDVILDYGYSRGESTMLLDHEVDQINRRNCDFGETSSITINAPDDMEDDLKFTPSIKSQTLPRQSRLFAPMSDPVPRSRSVTCHLCHHCHCCITSGQSRSFGNVKNDNQLSRLSWKLKIRSNSELNDILVQDFLTIKVHSIQKCFKLQNQCIYENQSPPHRAIMVI